MSQQKNPLLELILDRMKELGVKTQKELASKSGVGESTISRFFNGREATATNIYNILKCLDLICRPGEEKPAGVDIEHIDIIGRFENDRKRAREINRVLAIIDNEAPERMAAAQKAVRDVLLGMGPYIEKSTQADGEARKKA